MMKLKIQQFQQLKIYKEILWWQFRPKKMKIIGSKAILHKLKKSVIKYNNSFYKVYKELHKWRNKWGIINDMF